MINLSKGSSIKLEKDGRTLDNIYLGLNWGKINKFWGLLQQGVDLDASVSTFDINKRRIDTVSFKKRRSDDNAIYHRGDDLNGDNVHDEKDNEVININLKRISPRVEYIVLYLNSYRGQEFNTIPYANIRLLEGNANESKRTFATFRLATEPEFKGKVSMVMAKLVRDKDRWKFVTIGEATETKAIQDTVELIRHQYL